MGNISENAMDGHTSELSVIKAFSKLSSLPTEQSETNSPEGVIVQDTSLLEQCVLFQHLSAEDMEMIQSIVRREQFDQDQTIFNKGETSTALYLIVSGSVRVSVILDDIGEEVLAILKKGAHFGEMALVDDGPRSATVIALEKSECLRIDKKYFDLLIAKNTDLELRILRNMVKTFSARIRDTDQSLTFLRFTLRKD